MTLNAATDWMPPPCDDEFLAMRDMDTITRSVTGPLVLDRVLVGYGVVWCGVRWSGVE